MCWHNSILGNLVCPVATPLGQDSWKLVSAFLWTWPLCLSLSDFSLYSFIVINHSCAHHSITLSLGALTLLQIIFLYSTPSLWIEELLLWDYILEGPEYLRCACMHARLHAPLAPEIWSSAQDQYNMTLKACSQKYHHSGSRDTQLHVSCLCFGKLHGIPWRLCAVRFQKCQKKTQLQRAGRSWAEVLGKRKGKLINLSGPFSQLECNRFLHNKLLFLSSD